MQTACVNIIKWARIREPSLLLRSRNSLRNRRRLIYRVKLRGCPWEGNVRKTSPSRARPRNFAQKEKTIREQASASLSGNRATPWRQIQLILSVYTSYLKLITESTWKASGHTYKHNGLLIYEDELRTWPLVGGITCRDRHWIYIPCSAGVFWWASVEFYNLFSVWSSFSFFKTSGTVKSERGWGGDSLHRLPACLTLTVVHVIWLALVRGNFCFAG